MIFCETRHHTQAHDTSGTHIHCALSLAARKTQTAAQLQLRWLFCWLVFVMATSVEACWCCCCCSSLPPPPPPPYSLHSPLLLLILLFFFLFLVFFFLFLLLFFYCSSSSSSYFSSSSSSYTSFLLLFFFLLFLFFLLTIILPLLLLLLLLKIFFNVASLSTWFWVSVSNQNFTDGFLLKFYLFFFSGHCSIPTIGCLIYTAMYDAAH